MSIDHPQRITRFREAPGGPAGATPRRTRQADRLQMAGGLAHFRWSEPDGELVEVEVDMITAHRATLGAVERWSEGRPLPSRLADSPGIDRSRAVQLSKPPFSSEAGGVR